MSNLKIFSIALLSTLLLAVSFANAAGPSRIAFCSEGLNSHHDCKNSYGKFTSYGPVTLRMIIPAKYKKIAIWQGCIERKKTLFTKSYCMKTSNTWMVGKKIKHINEYQLRVNPKLDKLGKILRLGVRYYPKNGRGCMHHLVRMSYCQSVLDFRIES